MAISSNETFLEIVNVLTSSNCPLISRNDHWWMEELLFKPGKPRTDLIVWIISRLTNSIYPNETDNDSTATSSAYSNNFKIPESDEGILELLSNGGLCNEGDMPFVKGLLSVEKQLKFWELLMKPLQNIDKPFTNSIISAGYNSINNVTIMDNFLDAFQLSACLLPADVRSEIKQNSNGNLPIEEENPIPNGSNLLYDEAFTQTFLEKVEQLKSAAEKFNIMYNSDLKIISMKRESPGKLVELGASANLVHSKITTWKQNVDSLLELQKKTMFDGSRQKAEQILQRCLNDDAFQYFQELCRLE